MIVLAETQLTLGIGTAATIISTLAAAFIAFIFFHNKEIAKHKDKINDLKDEVRTQVHRIDSLTEKVAVHQSLIDKFTNRIFDIASQKEKEKDK